METKQERSEFISITIYVSFTLLKIYAVVNLQIEQINIVYIFLTDVGSLYNHSGDDSIEDPPVLIPNTEVKLDNAQSTWLDTAWKDR